LVCLILKSQHFPKSVGGTTMGRFPEYPLTPARQVGTV
jgi:hypothetical protein